MATPLFFLFVFSKANTEKLRR
uniref:Uncharacterized protein n=1 Tax=Rhizophora mucronata TaxID=61149 RepID=A0A2P2KKK1_RHIMU